MTAKELAKILEEDPEKEVTIRFRGGLAGSTIGVESCIRGFDWTSGQMVLQPEIPVVPLKAYENLKEKLRKLKEES